MFDTTDKITFCKHDYDTFSLIQEVAFKQKLFQASAKME